jgi:hypothetical protein
VKIIGAYDQGADGVELIVHLDETRIKQGPDGEGDLRPDPAWLWRAIVPGQEWQNDQLTALARVARLADREIKRRSRTKIDALIGADLGAYLTDVPTPQPETPADATD